ncbi:hypothetical protein ABD87_00130 [Lysinibacillus sphaericus]|uniref:helix-turn-helix domain-containing protein n=1 Tax=Lysinibacillus sphaericus TaxID=1421 RepID=UPI0018CFB270|nr:helix-turn-helix transcriptional regulator [Lysinibacillus sphaericus]MBG9727998.1 hypothetical protein [Lysinibacillus sphaericus]
MGENSVQARKMPSPEQYTYANLERVRKSKGISITFMARELGYKNPASYRKLEQGVVEIKIPVGIKIAMLLNEDFYSLFFEQKIL